MAAPVFNDGDPGPEIRRKLNEMGILFQEAIEGLFGPQGWSPVLAVVPDGERRVLEVVDWVGGQDTKPTELGYVGATGIVPDIADAVDIRGPVGDEGDPGPANSLDIGTVTEGVTAAATITGTAPSQTLNLVLPKATDGTDGGDGWTPIFALVADGSRVVMQVVDWTGGTDAKPAVGKYVGPTGLVTLIAEGVDVRGPAGSGGGGSGDVVGPAGAVNNGVALFDGVTGKLLKDGGVLGTAAFEAATSFATSSQGALAVSAVQPGDLAAVATSGAYGDLTGRPTLGTASSLNVAATGDAAAGEVVKGNDSRLTDARTPLAHTHNTADVVGLNTALLLLSDHLGATAGAHPATAITNAPAGGISATTVQAAINELDTEKLSDAPSDGDQYARKDGAWSKVVAGGAGYEVGDSLTTARVLSTPAWVEAGKVYLQSSYPALYAHAGDSALNVWSTYSTDQGGAPSAICAASPTVFVSVGGGGASTRSEDAGASWARVTGPNTTDFLNAVCAPSATVIVAVGDAGVVWRSITAGASWTKITTPNTTDRLLSVAALTSTALVAVGQAGVVWTSANSGASWTKITGPNTTDNLISVVALSSTTAVAIGTTGALWKTTNAGANWTKTIASTGYTLSRICMLDANTLVIVGSSNYTNTVILRSTNAGGLWSVMTPVNTTTNLRDVTALSATEVIAVGYRGVIWRSNDAGTTWFAVDDANKPSRSASLTCVAATSGNLAVAAGVDTDSFGSVVWRAGGFQHDPSTQFVTPYTVAAQAGLKQYIKA